MNNNWVCVPIGILALLNFCECIFACWGWIWAIPFVVAALGTGITAFIVKNFENFKKVNIVETLWMAVCPNLDFEPRPNTRIRSFIVFRCMRYLHYYHAYISPGKIHPSTHSNFKPVKPKRKNKSGIKSTDAVLNRIIRGMSCRYIHHIVLRDSWYVVTLQTGLVTTIWVICSMIVGAIVNDASYVSSVFSLSVYWSDEKPSHVYHTTTKIVWKFVDGCSQCETKLER